MAVLTTAVRKSLSKKSFALPPKTSGKNKTASTMKGRFPIPDANHARNALARASQGVKKGTLSTSQAATVRAKVRAKFPKIK